MGQFTLEEKRDFADRMRRYPTLAEKQLWWKLSHNQFGYRFIRQQLLGGFIVDFYCARLKLVIEVDGSIHENEDKAADDEQRERILENYGYLVLRFSNEDVLDHMTVVLTRIWDECSTRRAALKAFDSGSVLRSKGLNSSRVSRPCESVEKPLPAATVGKTSVDEAPKIPATAEDYAAINTAWRKLVRGQSNRYVVNMAPNVDDQKVRLVEWLRKRSESAALTVKGMQVTEPRRA